MSRRLALALAVVAQGCAQAGGAPTDASEAKLDGPQAIDAPMTHTIDAPMTSIDAPMATNTCATSTCAGAIALPLIDGDDGGVQLANGYQGAWYAIRVNEDDHGFFAEPMVLQTTLGEQTALMFDLFVYVNEGSDVLDCTAPTGTVTTNGTTEVSTLEWGETGAFDNGTDDSRTVEIEIRPKAGANCQPSDMWHLEIVGGS